VSSARNFTAFYKPETKAAIENIFLLEAEIEKLKILQNKTKSKTKRKNLKKQELEKKEEFKELTKELESYFYVDYYLPTTLLTKENDLALDNPIDESIQSTSEYYFSSIMTIIDGGNVVYESSS
jgi:FtsZ-binding cell division protein ZapB